MPSTVCQVRSRSLSALCLLAACASLLLGGCGGGGGGNNGGGGGGGTTNYTIAVASANPATGVSISYHLAQSGSDPVSGTTPFTVTASSGSTMLFLAPPTAGNNNFSSWTGCTSVSTMLCTVTVSGNVTITANYVTPVAPTVTVTPSPTTITTAQALSVAVVVAASQGGAVPTGSVVVTSGSYNSTATALSNGSATINIPAGTLATGTDSLKATYTPDSASSIAYATSSGTGSVTVNALPAPTMSIGLSSLSITTSQSLTATITVSGTPTPTGNVTLSSGSYTSSATALNAGVAVISVPAGSLAAGSDTLTATYTPDSSSSSTYSSGTKTASVSVSYAVSVASTNPASGVNITVSPKDVNGNGGGTTALSLAYGPNATVTLTAPATSTNGNTFNSWTGCSSTSGATCTLNVNAPATVTANYASVSVSPTTNVTIGQSQQFTATVTGLSPTTVIWSVAVASGTGSPGTISSTGLYQTPYPAPTSVTITATSTANAAVKGSATITLAAPATATGPALSIDADVSKATPISPLIYGMNAYLLDATTAQKANISVVRWGGDATSRYNYQNANSNSAADYYFQNGGAYAMLTTNANSLAAEANFNDFLAETAALGIKSIGTAPVQGYVSNSSTTACSFPKSSYPNQTSYNSSNCGNGVQTQGTQMPDNTTCNTSGGCSILGNSTTWQTTSVQEPPPTAPTPASGATAGWALSTWTGGWVNCLLTKSANCANAANQDASIWDLDNEPAWWDAVHRDVHPAPSTYDEVTNGGIGTALAIKTLDSNAQTGGPVIDYWWNYFYSKKDIESGWSTGPCYQPWSNPVDRKAAAHGGTPMMVYYLQQMASASNTYGMRLLDYLTIHAYVAGSYKGSQVSFTTAGDTAEQQVRMNSTRALWDPTYTDSAFPQPNYTTDSNYTSSCSVPLQAPQIIPMMQSWITSGWTGTSYPAPATSIDEYNFGGLESINGAVTQADVLGIFGKYNLNMGVFWPTDVYANQTGATMAFEIYRNYDGNKSTFGDQELGSTTADQSRLAVYAGSRTSDGAVTIVVINKTYGSLTDTLSVNNLASTATSAQVYQYSSANLNAIVAQPAATVAPPGSGSTISTIGGSSGQPMTFPGQSITLIVVPSH
ncbi:MAG TPA: glycoside hydrolase family 44 protein [Acidobacteriaceae bacterium]|nr:glycoside hydrolase family 44 protein [Acidobacteriaceae bacterium]